MFFLRLDHFWRDNLEFLDDLLVDLPTGGNVPLAQLASIETRTGPNQILRENGLRRIVVQCNVAGRDLGGVVEDIRDRVAAQVDFPEGYFVSYGGQFQSQVEATRLILLLSIISVTAIFVLLYSHFPASEPCPANHAHFAFEFHRSHSGHFPHGRHFVGGLAGGIYHPLGNLRPKRDHDDFPLSAPHAL